MDKANPWTQGTAGARPTIGSGYASFDGGDYLNSPTTTFMDGATDISISAWINQTTATANGGILLTLGTTSALYHGMAADTIASYDFVGLIANAGGTIGFKFASSQVGTWHLLTLTYSATSDKIRFYIDGAYQGEEAKVLSSISVNDYWRIGWNDTANRYWNGLIDECRIYNKALSHAEVTAVYNEGRPTVGTYP
jgi:hypothetical protein